MSALVPVSYPSFELKKCLLQAKNILNHRSKPACLIPLLFCNVLNRQVIFMPHSEACSLLYKCSGAWFPIDGIFKEPVGAKGYGRDG